METINRIDPVGRFLLLKQYVASVLCHPISGKLIGFVFRNRIPHRGSRIKVPEGGEPRINAALFWGIYESAEIRFVRSYLDGNCDVVELGSSLGGVSCEITRKLSTGRKLICVEANPNILSLLQKNLTLNAPNKNCRVIHGAISYDGDGYIDFVIGDSNLSSRQGTEGAVQKVPSLTLSGILEAESITDYALVCDIEGAEAQIFNRDHQAFSGCRTLVIELHSVTYQEIDYPPDGLVTLIEKNTSLRLVARYSNVCVFLKKSI